MHGSLPRIAVVFGMSVLCSKLPGRHKGDALGNLKPLISCDAGTPCILNQPPLAVLGAFCVTEGVIPPGSEVSRQMVGTKIATTVRPTAVAVISTIGGHVRYGIQVSASAFDTTKTDAAAAAQPIKRPETNENHRLPKGHRQQLSGCGAYTPEQQERPPPLDGRHDEGIYETRPRQAIDQPQKEVVRIRLIC